MSDGEYEAFHSKLVTEYAQVNVEAGNWLEEESQELSKKALEQLLPEGRQTPRVLLLSADNAVGEYVGYVWISLDRPGTSKPSAWIYDIEVARRLYESSGYSITQMAMSKQLGPAQIPDN